MLVQVVSGLCFQAFEFGPLLWSLCMWVITGQYIAARILLHLREFCTLITLDSGSCGLRLVAHWLFLISLITFPICRQGEKMYSAGVYWATRGNGSFGTESSCSAPASMKLPHPRTVSTSLCSEASLLLCCILFWF